MVYYDKSELDKAIDDYTSELRINPKNAEAARGRGHAYYEKDDLERARTDLSTAVDLDPQDSARAGHPWLNLLRAR